MPNYGEMIKRSIEVVKKNKWLLVYGLVLSSVSGSGGGGGGGNGTSFLSEIENLKESPQSIPEDITNSTKQVLGSYTNTIIDWFNSVSPLVWIMLIFAITAAIIFAIIIGLIIRNWAKGSLISGVQLALQDQQVNLKNSSPRGLAKLKDLIKLSVITTIIPLLILATALISWIIAYFLFQYITFLKILWIILGAIAAFLVFFLMIIAISMITVYAERLIMLYDHKPWSAFKEGFVISKQNFTSTAVMGILNSVIGGIVGFVVLIVILIILGIPSLIILVPAFMNKRLPSIPAILLLVLFVFIFIYVNVAVKAAISVFKYSNWNQIFEHVYKEKEED